MDGTLLMIPDKLAKMNFAITSSKFMYGSSPKFPTLSPGLNIVLYQQCSHVTIQINNSIMSENQKDEKVVTLFGANLAISIFHPSGNSGFHDIVIENCHIEGGRAVFGGGISLSVHVSWNQFLRLPEVSCIVNHTDLCVAFSYSSSFCYFSIV